MQRREREKECLDGECAEMKGREERSAEMKGKGGEERSAGQGFLG